MEELIKEIVSHCKCEVSISFNQHTTSYCTIAEFCKENEINQVRAKAIEDNGMLIQISCYDETPIGYYTVYHYDLICGLREMLYILRTNEEDNQ